MPLQLDNVNYDTLLTFFMLPNVFSRDAYFSFAVDSYNNPYLEESIFITRQNDIGPVSHMGDKTTNANRHFVWLDLCKRFVLFFTKLIFPVYERSFLLLLRQYVSTYSKSPDEECLNLLHNYISAHSDDILCWDDQPNELKPILKKPCSSFPEMILERREEAELVSRLVRNIVTRENSIVNPAISMTSDESLGFKPGSSYHRQLMNLTIAAMLQDY